MSTRAKPPDELDRSALERCVKQDPLAFRAFVVRYERAVYSVVSRIVGTHGPVEDLAQEAFLRAFRAFPSFDVSAPGRASTWLLTIAVRLAIDEKRRRSAGRELAQDTADAPTAVEVRTPFTDLSDLEMGRAISQAVESLSVDQRACFVLAHFHARTLEEIASMVDTPEATVKTRLFRAREKLRFALAEWRDEEVS